MKGGTLELNSQFRPFNFKRVSTDKIRRTDTLNHIICRSIHSLSLDIYLCMYVCMYVYPVSSVMAIWYIACRVSVMQCDGAAIIISHYHTPFSHLLH